jgi:hypothetical protein
MKMSENPTAIAIWRSGHLPMLDGSQLERRKLASALTAQRTAETAQRTAQNLVSQLRAQLAAHGTNKG